MSEVEALRLLLEVKRVELRGEVRVGLRRELTCEDFAKVTKIVMIWRVLEW